jgi:hypothetical protein
MFGQRPSALLGLSHSAYEALYIDWSCAFLIVADELKDQEAQKAKAPKENYVKEDKDSFGFGLSEEHWETLVGD